MAKRGTSNPRIRSANPGVVEYLGQNFVGKGTMTDLFGHGMKTLGTYLQPIPTCASRSSYWWVNLPYRFRSLATICDGYAI